MEKLTFDELVKKNTEENTNSDNIISLIALNNLLSLDNLKSNSRISKSQVSELTKLYMFAKIFEVPIVSDIANNILQLQISINGLGRKELVEIARSVTDTNNIIENQQLTKKDIFR